MGRCVHATGPCYIAPSRSEKRGPDMTVQGHAGGYQVQTSAMNSEAQTLDTAGDDVGVIARAVKDTAATPRTFSAAPTRAPHIQTSPVTGRQVRSWRAPCTSWPTRCGCPRRTTRAPSTRLHRHERGGRRGRDDDARARGGCSRAGLPHHARARHAAARPVRLRLSVLRTAYESALLPSPRQRPHPSWLTQANPPPTARK